MDILGSSATANDYMPEAYYKLWKEMMADPGHDFYSPENQSNDAKAIRQYAQQRETVNPNKPGSSYAACENSYAKAYNLGLIRTPGSPEIIDLSAEYIVNPGSPNIGPNAEITRAEYCYLLWKAGLTSFGCYTPPDAKGLSQPNNAAGRR